MIERVFSRITALVITFAMVFSACSSIVFAAETPVVEKELVSIACFGQNGTISISTTPVQVTNENPEYYVGDEITFTVSPKEGYYLHGVDFSGGYPGQGTDGVASYDQINPLFTSLFKNGVQTLTLTVPKPTTGNQLMIYANFEQIPYDMEVEIFGEGNITVSPEKAKGGDTVVFKPEPAAGYELTGLGFVSFVENSDGELAPTAPTAIDPAFTKNDDGSYSSIVPENITKLLPFGANFTKIPEVIPEAPKLGDQFTENGIKYQVTSLEKPTASVVGYTDAMPAEVELPGTVTYKDTAFTVTTIGNSAFWDCTGLTSVTIPEGVTAIDEGAFYGCIGLTSVTIPEGVTTIGVYAFLGCTNLTSITIPKSVTAIGVFAFWGCTNLTSITILEGVTTIGDGAFWGCLALTDITIPKSVTTIGNYAFYCCSELKSITIPESVTTISNYVFGGCTGLTNITIPEGVTAIGNYAFYNCSELKSITIPESVTTISDYVFGGCTGLTNITIPEGVTTIGKGAFYYCSGLKSITIPESVTTISDYVFGGCTGLTNLTIPEGVTTICNYAFDNCTGLTSISVDINNKTYCSENGILFDKQKTVLIQYPAGKSESTYIIPGSVKLLNTAAFGSCTALTSITIPASVTSIGNSAFFGCGSLKEIIFLEKPKDGKYRISIGSGAFLNINSNAIFCGYNPTPLADISQDKWVDITPNVMPVLPVPGAVTVTVGSEIIKTTITPITSATAVIFDRYAASVDESLVCIGGADISIAESAKGKTAVVALTFSREAVSKYDVNKAVVLHLNDNGVMDKLSVNVTYKNDYAVLTSIARKFSPFAVYAPLKTDTSTDTSTNPSTDTSTNPSTDTSTNTSTSTSKNTSTKPSTHSTPKSLTSNNPKTGDSSNIFPWAALLFVSGGVLTALGTKKKNHKQR